MNYAYELKSNLTVLKTVLDTYNEMEAVIEYTFYCVLQIQKTNFSSVADLELLLDSLQRTFAEFKMHEQIENRLIMKRLKNKLNTLSIRNTLVCNCHKVSLQGSGMILNSTFFLSF